MNDKSEVVESVVIRKRDWDRLDEIETLIDKWREDPYSSADLVEQIEEIINEMQWVAPEPVYDLRN